MHRRAAVCLALLITGCGPPPVVPLHARGFFGGRIAVAVEGGPAPQRFEAELAFDHAAANYQLTFRRGAEGERADSLALLPTGEVRGFSNGVVGPPAPADRAAFDLVRALLRAPPPTARVEAWADGYAILDGATTTTVELRETEPHSKR